MLWGALPLLALALSATENEISDLENGVALIDPQLTYLTTEYVKRDLYDRPSVQRRITDGEILHLLGDYTRASIVLYDVISRDDAIDHPMYDEALFYLAESEFQVRNFFGARYYFRQLISRGSAKHSFEAFGRLIEIADRLADYSGVEEKVAELRAAGSGVLRPDIAYFYGKSLARRGRSQLALKELEIIPPEHKFYHRARYIVGVERVRMGELEASLPVFDEVMHAPQPLGRGPTSTEQAKMHELAALALARVHNELGHGSEALDMYSEVPRTSEYFEEMLYEVSWAYIRRSNETHSEVERAGLLQKAVQALDLVLLDQTNRAILPQAKVLKGNVLLRLNRHDEATQAFDEVSAQYGAAVAELDETAQRPDIIAYFNELISKNHGVFSAAAFLPPLAVNFAAAEKDVERALGISNDLDASHAAIDEARQISDRLIAAMSTKRAVEYYPRLQEGELKALEIEGDIINKLEAASRLLGAAVQPGLSSAERSKLDTDTVARRKLYDEYRTLPKSGEALKARKRQYDQSFDRADKQVFALSYEIEGARAQLVAVSKWVDDMAARKKLSKAQITMLRQQVDNEMRVITELDRQALQSKRDADRGRSELSLSGDPDGREDKLRAEYIAAVQREMTVLTGAAARLDEAARPAAERLLAARRHLDDYLRKLDDFHRVVESVVSRKASEVAEAVRVEQERLAQYERELGSFGGDAKDLVGSVAHKTFEVVRSKFHDLVLRADVGDIDVAWRRKEERTEAINKLVKEQKDSLTDLDRDFHDVLGDEGNP